MRHSGPVLVIDVLAVRTRVRRAGFWGLEAPHECLAGAHGDNPRAHRSCAIARTDLGLPSSRAARRACLNKLGRSGRRRQSRGVTLRVTQPSHGTTRALASAPWTDARSCKYYPISWTFCTACTATGVRTARCASRSQFQRTRPAATGPNDGRTQTWACSPNAQSVASASVFMRARSARDTAHGMCSTAGLARTTQHRCGGQLPVGHYLDRTAQILTCCSMSFCCMRCCRAGLTVQGRTSHGAEREAAQPRARK